MHYSTFLYGVTALYAASVSSYCFGSGANWGDHKVAIDQVVEACTDRIAGLFQAGQSKRVCRNSPSEDKSFVFEVWSRSEAELELASAACAGVFMGIINDCGHGGEKISTAFRYRCVP